MTGAITHPGSDADSLIADLARAGRGAQLQLARMPSAQRADGLRAAAAALRAQQAVILAANAEDMAAGAARGLSAAMLDRLKLDPARLAGIADAVAAVADLPDPVGCEIDSTARPNGLVLSRVRVPIGLIGIIYESRPNVTADAAALCLRSGNAVLLRGSGSAADSNAAIVAVLRDVLAAHDLNPDAVSLLPAHDRASVTALIQARGLVDVVIPRGGAGLINAVVANATVPTIETGTGNCHVYVHSAADLDMAETVVVNAKARRPSVCNAAETVLIDEAIVDVALPRLTDALKAAGVTIHGDEPGMEPADEKDWSEEYLSLDIAVRRVAGLDEAVEHISRYGTGHTEAIITSDLAAANEFTNRVDAAAVVVNASTAFTDGEQFGFGAEIGISTQKLHARGPMGLPELTSTKWVVWGNGQIRPA